MQAVVTVRKPDDSRYLPSTIFNNERLLIASGHPRATVPLSANPSRSHGGRGAPIDDISNQYREVQMQASIGMLDAAR
jgi:hypothetical protein